SKLGNIKKMWHNDIMRILQKGRADLPNGTNPPHLVIWFILFSGKSMSLEAGLCLMIGERVSQKPIWRHLKYKCKKGF
ncbi:MAG: hypothetical protein AAFN11_00035, partial [Chloroflexota bacterium]